MLGKASLTGRRSEDSPGNLRSRDGELEVAASDEWVRIDNFVVNERLVKPAEMRRLIPA
jgi:hypothetical protein